MTKTLQTTSRTAAVGDLAQLVGERENNYIVRLQPGKTFQTHLGILSHNDLIGQTWGTRVKTHLGKIYLLLQPSLDDLLRTIKRETQIMYPKDIGYIMVTMGIGAGTHVIEAGTGSGSLTTALAYSVGQEGRVYSYERKEKHQTIARQNLETFGLDDRVTFRVKDIADGFDENDVQAAFLDLPDPHNYIPQVREALLPGGFFGSLLPTTNQVSELITALRRNNFAFIEVSEILHRYYKPSATRLRPMDTMNAHTGFLVFARRVTGYNELNDENESE